MPAGCSVYYKALVLPCLCGNTTELSALRSRVSNFLVTVLLVTPAAGCGPLRYRPQPPSLPLPSPSSLPALGDRHRKPHIEEDRVLHSSGIRTLLCRLFRSPTMD
uniref:Uncharacterized protein n=1 Tax=Ananas comosus var. bracteatus TaxID=296719 RepID=A0A6V7NX00_ANACO|nr:unnamed protein product [Ananas comosus var. bracteatus]